MEFCELILGNRGSGKTLGLEVECFRVAEQGEYALCAFDVKGDFARRMVGHLCSQGMERRTLIEIARKARRSLQWPFFKAPKDPDPIEQGIKVRLAIHEFCQVFWGTRDLKDGKQKPYTKDWMENAVRVWASQPTLRPVQDLLALFDPVDARRREMLGRAADRAAAREFEMLDQRAAKNPIQWEVEAGASKRLMKIVGSDAVWPHHGDTTLWRDVLRGRMQVYFDLSAIPPEDARFLVLAVVNAVISECREHFTRTGKPLKVVIVLEEAGFLDLVTPQVITSLQGDRAAGIVYWVVSQTTSDFPEETLEQLMGLTQVRRYYNIHSGLDRASEDLADPTYDPLDIHYTRERMQATGEFEEIHTRSHGESKDEHGHGIRKDERESVSYRPRYRVVVDEFYTTPQVHRQKFRTDLTRNKTGQRHVRDVNGVRRETVKPLGPAWPLGLTEARTSAAIERIRSRPVFREVPVESSQCKDPTPPPDTTPAKPRGRPPRPPKGSPML